MTNNYRGHLGGLFKASALAVAVSFSGLAGAEDWSYYGDTGPDHWADLSEAFALCGSLSQPAGSEQSPIDLRDAESADLHDIELDWDSYPLNVENNGHTIQVNYAPGSTMETAKRNKYYLLQFHFHTPSEHTVSGVPAAMEVHFVHMNSRGQLAVLGVLVNDSHDGTDNEVLAEILANAPEEKGKNALATDHRAIDAQALLPGHDDEIERFWHYNGSLTTPPCSEGVKWYVAKDHIHASHDQIHEFTHLMVHEPAMGNARPTQALNERTLKQNKD